MTKPAPAPARRWQRLEHDERRGQILAVARHLFSERSYRDVSAEEVAVAAGVRRGLLHHYFGSKRDLFLAVVRDLLARAAMPFEGEAAGSADEVLERSVDRWLDFVERDAGAWFAVLDVEGLGSDRELQNLVGAARDATVERIISALGIAEPSAALRAVLRTYAGLAEEATREWLQRKTLTRAETRALLVAALRCMVHDVAPAVQGES